MESNALEKSTNNSVVLSFFAWTPSRIQQIVKICDVLDRFLLFGRMVPSLLKIAKRTNNNNAIAYWSQQTYTLFSTQARAATTVLNMPNARHNQTHSPWVKVFNDTRKYYFHANTMKDFFENIHMDNVLSFLKETGLYQKI